MRQVLVLCALGLVLGAAQAAAQSSPRGYGTGSGGYGSGYGSGSGSGSGWGSNPRSHSNGGYYNDRGTYVAPYRQTNPNNTQMDNYGTRGNHNPYTGSIGTRRPRY